MQRIFLIYTVLLLLPGIVLTYAALHLAGSERNEALRLLQERSAEEADRLKKEIENALKETIEKAKETDLPAAYLSSDGTIHYSETLTRKESEPEAEELYYFNLSLRGGESFEFAKNNPSRAIDAYSFYLPRINAIDLKCRLKYCIARTALSDGKELFAAVIFRDLFQYAYGVYTKESLPIDLLSGLNLLELVPDKRDEIRETLSRYLKEYHKFLSTPFLNYIIRQTEIADPFFKDLVLQRENLERAIVFNRSELEKNGSALNDDFLLISNKKRGSSIRSITMTPVQWPSFNRVKRFHVTFRKNLKQEKMNEAEQTILPIRTEVHSFPAGYLYVKDLEYKNKADRIDHLWFLGCVLIITAICATLAGTLALVRFALKERHLSRLRNRLITNVSHELKSPVTSIRLFSDMLAEETLDHDRTRRFGKLLRSESMRLSQLINNLLDFSRMGRKEVALELEPVSITAVVKRVAENFGYRAREKKFKFDVKLPAEKGDAEKDGLIAFANAFAVERITLNFLDNALKYCRTKDPEICLTARKEDEKIIVSVSDNGQGIPASEKEKIFEPFYRIDYEDYAVRGSGLGLSLTRELSCKMGGEIKLKSRTGEGNTFLLEIPVREYQSPHKGTHKEGDNT